MLDVLPRTLRLLPWRQRLGLTLHVVASHALPDDLAALLRQHSGRVKFHGHLSDEEVSRPTAGPLQQQQQWCSGVPHPLCPTLWRVWEGGGLRTKDQCRGKTAEEAWLWLHVFR